MAQASRPAAGTSSIATPAPSPTAETAAAAPSHGQSEAAGKVGRRPPLPCLPCLARSVVPLNNSVDEKLGRVPNVDRDECALPDKEEETGAGD